MHSGFMDGYYGQTQALFGALPIGGNRVTGRFYVDGSLSVLRLLGSGPDSHGIYHRCLGQRP